jgi:Chloroplast import apparatus Tic20-like
MFRKQNTIQDRIFACLTYLIPLIEIYPFGFILFLFFPPLGILFLPLMKIAPIYNLSVGGIAVVSWGIFLTLYICVVLNRNYSYILRFNTMQALLIGIFAALCSAFLRLFNSSTELFISGIDTTGGIASLMGLGILNLGLLIIMTLIFIATVAACIYAVIQTCRGEIAHFPIISDAANSQVY